MSNVIKTQFLRKISLRNVKRSWRRIYMLIKWLLSCFSCSKELGQWDLLMEFGKTKGHANPFLGKFIWLHLLIFIVLLTFVISCISFDHCGLWTNLCRLSFFGSFYVLNCAVYDLLCVTFCWYTSDLHIEKLLYFSYLSSWERMASTWVAINERCSRSGED